MVVSICMETGKPEEKSAYFLESPASLEKSFLVHVGLAKEGHSPPFPMSVSPISPGAGVARVHWRFLHSAF